MTLTMTLFVSPEVHSENELKRIEALLGKIHSKLKIKYKKELITDQKSFTKYLFETYIAQRAHLRIPRTGTGYITIVLLIYKDDEPLVWYPHKKARHEGIPIDDFLKSLWEERPIPSMASPGVTENLNAEIEKLHNISEI